MTVPTHASACPRSSRPTPPIVVLSDLHLGHPASYLSDPTALMPILGDARTAIFNGDTFELLDAGWRPGARDRARRLLDLCLARGVQPVLVTGNHDPYASSLHHVDLFDGRVFITHGDALHPYVAPWSREAPALREEHLRLLLGQSEPKDLDELLLLTKRTAMVGGHCDHTDKPGLLARIEMVGRFGVKPWRIVKALRYWASVPRLSRALRARHRPDCKLMIIGHTHRSGVWRHRDFTLINTGSYQPLSRPLIVRLDESTVRVWPVHRQAGGFIRGREMLHQPF